MLHSTGPDASGQTLLAAHPRAVGRGAHGVEETRWDGVPTSKGRRITTGYVLLQPRREPSATSQAGPLQALLNRTAITQIEVGHRPLSVYHELTGTRPFASNSPTKNSS